MASNFGEMLSMFRRRAGLTITGLAERGAVHRNTLSSWEKGQRLPRTAALMDVASALSLTNEEVSELIDAANRIRDNPYDEYTITPHSGRNPLEGMNEGERAEFVQRAFDLLERLEGSHQQVKEALQSLAQRSSAADSADKHASSPGHPGIQLAVSFVERPQKPVKNASFDDWFAYYHACRKLKIRYTLKDLACDVDRSYIYVRQLHAQYKEGHEDQEEQAKNEQ